jgi:hypothetical protein
MTLKGHIRFNKTEATHLIKMAKDFFGELSIDKEDNREYLKPARYKKIMIIVNWEQPEWNRGVASLALFAWNYHAEFFVLNYTGSDWKRWLLGEVLQNLVGRQYLKECTFLVHRVEDKLGNRQKISDDVAETISTYVATSQT